MPVVQIRLGVHDVASAIHFVCPHVFDTAYLLRYLLGAVQLGWVHYIDSIFLLFRRHHKANFYRMC